MDVRDEARRSEMIRAFGEGGNESEDWVSDFEYVDRMYEKHAAAGQIQDSETRHNIQEQKWLAAVTTQCAVERMRQLNAIADAAKAILAYGEHGGVDMDNHGNGWLNWEPLYEALKQAVENLEKGE